MLPTMLYVPGNDQRKLDKLTSIKVSAFILDLEDAVALSSKASARVQVRHFLADYKATPQVYIRVNDFSSQLLYDDLKEIVVPGLNGIVLPKVSDANQIKTIDWFLGVLEKERGISSGSIRVLPLIENVEGVEKLDSIASASPRLTGFGFGAGDFSLDIGLEWPSPSGNLSQTIINAKIQLVVVSRRNGLEPPHDGVYANFKDSEGLYNEATQSKALGFFGKHVIHPMQIAVVERVFLPSQDEIDRAQKIVEVFDKSEQSGIAAVSYEGQLVDYPVADRARKLLVWANSMSQEK